MGSRRSPRDYNIPVTIRESLKSPQPETDARPVRLMREVRFSIDRDWVRAARGESGFEKALPVTNSWGGWPSAVGVAPFLVLRIIVSGTPDPVTGYLVNIQELDRLLRRHAIPVAAQRLSTSGVGLAGESLLAAIFERVRTRVPDRCRLETLSLLVTPYLSYAINERDSTMVELTQCFEFSASHRLHVPDLSDEENLGTFGKCNNPNGHGHNYQLEVTVAGSPNAKTGMLMPVAELEQIVKRHVIDRLDHKHLNDDCAEFAKLNPSVENITKVIWSLLGSHVAPARLERVRVHETPKTYAEYAGPRG
jgi:6-pyruvoyltetrahydropterin/6-carboxytetrahydropterin synthase